MIYARQRQDGAEAANLGRATLHSDAGLAFPVFSRRSETGGVFSARVHGVHFCAYPIPNAYEQFAGVRNAV